MVEIIPKPREKEPLWPNILLAFSVLILIGAVIAYFLLGYFIKTNQEIIEVKEKAERQPRSSEEQETEKEVLQYKKKIDDFTPFLNQHKISSEFFNFLEKIIHPQVWISDLTLDVQKAETQISGEAEKTALGQQLLIFQENEQILEANLSSIQIEEGEKVNFTILLSFDPEMFKFLK